MAHPTVYDSTGAAQIIVGSHVSFPNPDGTLTPATGYVTQMHVSHGPYTRLSIKPDAGGPALSRHNTRCTVIA